MSVSVVPTSSRPVMVVDGDGRVSALTTSSTDDRFCVSISSVLDAGASEHVRDACLGGGDLDVIVDPRQVSDAASSNWTARPLYTVLSKFDRQSSGPSVRSSPTP